MNEKKALLNQLDESEKRARLLSESTISEDEKETNVIKADLKMLKERVKAVRLDFGLKQNEMAKKLGFAQSTYTNYENGNRDIPYDLLEKLIDVCQVNPFWLMTGLGDMFINQVLIPKGNGYIPVENVAHDENTVYVDILDMKVSAGHGIENYDIEVIGKFPLIYKIIYPYKPEQVKVIEVKGDSMTPTIYDGDFILYVPEMVQGEGIYVASNHGEVIVKRIQFNFDRSIEVISDNPRYKTVAISPDNDFFRICGKVIGWVHKHRY